MKLDNMTKDEKSLLLFLETQAVDYGGRVDVRHMNEDDMNIAEKWNNDKFIGFGRICSNDVIRIGGRTSTCWVTFSDEAFRLAHEERKARAKRMWDKRKWITTEEKRNENS